MSEEVDYCLEHGDQFLVAVNRFTGVKMCLTCKKPTKVRNRDAYELLLMALGGYFDETD